LTLIFFTKASINNLQEADLSAFRSADEIVLHQGAIVYADGVIQAEDGLNDSLQRAIDDITEKPLLKMEGEDIFSGIPDFYRAILPVEEN